LCGFNFRIEFADAMAQYFQIHPTHPQPRLIKRAVEIVRMGGVIVYPTDSSYAIGCHLGDKGAMERIRRLRRLDDDHNFTLMCRDLSELAQYARVSNSDFRLLKAHTPGPYTFILPATREVPRRLQHVKRKTIGLRVPDHATTLALLAELNEPLMSVTMILPGDELPLADPEEIRVRLQHDVDLVVDGGFCGLEPTTVVVLEDGTATVTRSGKGDSAPFGGAGLPSEEPA
jgi:tRNA threonylcarbamoyl adenosine modification protein (Sua5/YciO/YrdC/YwlC family)